MDKGKHFEHLDLVLFLNYSKYDQICGHGYYFVIQNVDPCPNE